ncbi:MAG: CpaF family protein [Bradymonadaceae bacterium]
MIPQEVFEQSILRYFDPIRPFLEDDEISDTVDDLKGGVKQIAQYVDKPLDELHPRMDARLPDGSRVHVVLPPCSREGITVAIRQFGEFTLTMDKLIDWGSVSPDAAAFLEACVRLKKNIVVAGGTGSGKTSLLNVLSAQIPPQERILVIEDSSELQFQQPHVVMMEARKPDAKGRGEVTIGDLFHSAMRLRPDRVVIGEVRGKEALSMLQAMTTGHSGSMTTTHATYPDDTLRRLETMAMMSDMEMPLHALRSQVASAVELIVQQSRFNDGSRKITDIVEVLDLEEGGEYQTRPLFKFNHRGEDRDGTVLGDLEPLGNQPTFLDQAESKGIEMRPSWFQPNR